MRVPRRHRFRIEGSADALFRKLPPMHRFRFSPGPGAATVLGAGPVFSVETLREDPRTLPARRLRELLPRVPPIGEGGAFPGGAVGYIAYERGDVLEGLPPRPADPRDPADLWFGIYDTFAIWRPPAEAEVVSWGLTPDGGFDGALALHRAGELEERLRGSGPGAVPLPRAGNVRASLEREEHTRAVGSILEAIARGDLYQANLTVRFDVDLPGDGVPLFERLVHDNPAPGAAFVEAPGATVLSSSPESLLRVVERRVETRPVKGTARRDPDPARDRRLGEALLASEKDRAELLMITDLLRNDLGKVCEYGSVRVPHLRSLESFPHVHHLVSTVTGRLPRGRDALDALAAVFPCGSVTGAPKRRAMQMLRELEPAPRGVYTGAVGWIGFDRSAEFHVAIRTGHLRNGVFSFGAGGGIVADSDPDAEWEELILKTRAFGLALELDLEAAVSEGIPQ